MLQFSYPGKSLARGMVYVHGDVPPPGDGAQPSAVVSVFVGDQKGVEIFRGRADGIQPVTDFTGRQPRVDQ
jgi:hypothetical protein